MKIISILSIIIFKLMLPRIFSLNSNSLPKSIKGNMREEFLSVIKATGLLTTVVINPLNSRAKTTSDTINTQRLSQSPNMFQQIVVKNDDSTFINGLISGSVSRATKEILLHPIDTIRARQQIQDSNITYSYNVSDLYSGILPALVGGIPAGAIFFGVKDYSKSKFRKLGMNRQVSTILSVVCANIPYWLIRNPLEVVKTKLQVEGDDVNDRNSIEKLYMIYNTKGLHDLVNVLYSSYLSNFAYALPSDIIKFLAYEILKSRLWKKDDDMKVEGFEAAVIGSIASLVAQIATTPLDVIRTRIMLQSTSIDNPFLALNEIVSNEGVVALTKGIEARSFRAICSGGIQFASYELANNWNKS